MSFELILVLLILLLSAGLLFLLYQYQKTIFKIWEIVDIIDYRLVKAFSVLINKQETINSKIDGVWDKFDSLKALLVEDISKKE